MILKSFYKIKLHCSLFCWWPPPPPPPPSGKVHFIKLKDRILKTVGGVLTNKMYFT
jgi:hypothetical protein